MGIVFVSAAVILRIPSVSSEILVEAVRSRHYGIAKTLVITGANPNSKMNDDSGRSLLHLVSASGDVDMIHFLVRHGAEVDLRATFGVTPRAEAQMAHQTEAERVLVEYGAVPVPPDLHVP